MKPYAVAVSPRVHAIVREMVLHIAQDSVGNALAWEDRLGQAVQRIGDLPHGYPVDADASARFGRPVRKVFFEGAYLIFYHADDANRTAFVLNIRHGARLPRAGEP